MDTNLTKTNNSFCFSIVIITRNRRFLLEETLIPFLYFATEKNGEVIVVDDCSIDDTVVFLKSNLEKFQCLRIFVNEVNKGIGESRNIGILNANSEIILSIDDDIVIDWTIMEHSIKAFDIYPEAGIIAPLIIEKETGLPLNGVTFNDENEVKQVANYCGGFGILRKSAVIKAGCFDKETTYGADERSLSMKVFDLGYKILFIPKLKCLHIDTVDRSKPIPERFNKLVFNNVRLNFKYLPFFYASLFSLRYLFVMQIIGRRLFPKGSFKMIVSALHGMKNGLIFHTKLKHSTIRYYTSYKLQPQYGNRLLIDRVICKFRR